MTITKETMVLADEIRRLADAMGIDALGFAQAAEFAGYKLHDSPRRDPQLTLPGAKTIIVGGVYIGGVTLPAWNNPWYGRTSRLYLSGYFLDVVDPLQPVADFLRSRGYQAVVCEGSRENGSILPLKLAAVRAGLGWQGKQSLLVTKEYGTFLALGGIITDAAIEPDAAKQPNRCRGCDKCQRACPLGALEKAHCLNMDRCLSYRLQEEHLPQEAEAVMDNRVGDCEICQEACPWNKRHLENPLATGLGESFKEKIDDWEKFFYLPDLVKVSEEEYWEKLGSLNTAIPYHLFHRNALIALDHAQNSGARPGR